MPLTFAITGTLISLMSGRAILAAIGIALGILLKGPIGIILPVAVVCIWVLSQRWQEGTSNRKLLLQTLLASAIGCLLALPWFCWMNAQTDGEFLRVFFWYHHVQRALGGARLWPRTLGGITFPASPSTLCLGRRLSSQLAAVYAVRPNRAPIARPSLAWSGS